MIKNIIKYITCLIVFLFLISAASASDINDFQMENNSLAVTNTNNYKTLQETIDNTPEYGIIQLTQNITYNQSTDTDLVEGIVINKSITIDGLNFQINGDNKARIFKIVGDNVIIKNIYLVNGKFDDGGAIFNVGVNTTIIDSNFINNTAAPLYGTSDYSNYGGAIFNYGENFKILGTNIFVNNTAFSGGAIFNVNGNSFFKYWEYENKTGSNFLISGNNAFYNNTAYMGGVINNNKARNFTITGNNNFANNKIILYTGAVIFNTGNDFYINGTNSFKNNFADGNSGVIENEGNNFLVKGNNIFENNIATYNGGVIINSGLNFTITGSNKFYNNIAQSSGYHQGGGSIENSGNDFKIIGTNEFINNQANGHGGAILNFGQNMLITGKNIFNNNKAAGYGGAISNEAGGKITIVGNEFNNNTADVFGTVIFSRNYEPSKESDKKGAYINITNSNLNGTYFLVCSMGQLYLKNNTMTSNSAPIRQYYASTYPELTAIISETYITILNNQTYYSLFNSNVTLTAIITDDNGNMIVGEELTFIIDDFRKSIKVPDYYTGIYSCEYETNQLGIKTVNASAQKLTSYTSIKGTLNVINNEMNILTSLNGNNLTINIQFSNSSTSGNVIIKIGNKTNVLQIINGVVVFSINIDPDDYIAYITYSSNQLNFLNSTKSIELKNSTNIKIDAENIEYGNNATITITLTPNLSTDVEVKVNNQYYIIRLINGEGTLNLTGLNIGKYNISVFYNGDISHASTTQTASFNVEKSTASMDININDIIYGKYTVINITMNPDVEGNITLYINGADGIKKLIGTFNLTNGKLEYILSDLSGGWYLITSEYNGNDYYKTNSQIKDFYVEKLITYTQIEVINLVYNENTTVIITVTPNTTGQIMIYINDKYKGIYSLNNGQYQYLLDLPAGIHNITINYYGNENYTESANFKEFTIKQKTNLDINTTDISYGETAEINISLHPNTEGNVTIYINGENNGTYSLINGKLLYELLNLEVETYNITVVFNGNENYITSSNTSILTVKKINTLINLNLTNMTYGDDKFIIMTITPNVKGNITIFLNDVNKGTYNLINGQYHYLMNELDAGKYNITVIFSGNKNYNSSISNGTFEIIKSNTHITIEPSNINYGETIKITVSPNAEGNVTIYINNENKGTYTLINGQYSYQSTNLNLEEYNFTIIYNGNKNFNTSSNSTLITINKGNVIINLTANNISYGENTVLNIKLSYPINDTIIIKINNQEIGQFRTVNGEFNYPLTNLEIGIYNITVIFNGNGLYNNSTNNTILEVSKINTTISIDVKNNDYKENTEIKIIVSPNTTGTIDIEINGKKETYTLTNSQYVYTISSLNGGNHNLKVTFNGNNHYANSTKTTILTINKINPEFSLKNITDSYNEIITINTNLDTSGSVQVTIAEKTYNSVINNGVIEIKNINLNIGEYDVYLKYDGDTNYNPLNIVLKLSVTSSVNLIGNNIIMYYKDGSQYVITVLDNLNKPLSGKELIISINEIDYKITTNSRGEGYVNINEQPGNYIITSTLKSDGKYPEKSISNTLQVKSTIIAENLIKYYLNDTQFIAQFLDSKGNPLINKDIKIEVIGSGNYTRKTNDSGMIKFTINLNPGTYTLSLINPNDGLKINYSIKVLSTIRGADITKYYLNGTQYIAYFIDGSGQPLKDATININTHGREYTRITDQNGKITMTINLHPGNYTITVWAPNGEAQTNNMKIIPTVYGYDLNKKFGTLGSYEVKILDGQGNPFANQVVDINIHGILYHKTTESDGIARLNINLDPNSYIATATWNNYSTSNIVNVYT
ncbi:Ig-like domain repeat protein [Methanobrevibacter sp. OttesenSCG-928-I08]|nr:Ig-like domain repeat protein [Methanobrevibacter sp. OttesenSCG-928-I08]